MAKRSRKRSRSMTLARHAPRQSRFRSIVRHTGGKIAEEKHMVGALVAAGALGVAESQGIKIPTIGTMGEAATLGIAAYALDKFGVVKSKMLRHAATGLLSIAVYEFAKKETAKGGGGVQGYDEQVDTSYRND